MYQPLYSQLTRTGVKFTIDTEEGQALLGTAHGKSVARWVLHHRDSLGRKKVASVHYFRTTELMFNLAWEIVDE